MKYDIFISYRRDGGDTLAQLIYDRLTDRGYRVFLDIESLRSGKFNEKLFSVISECKDVIVILPPGALERCRNEGDWLFLEVSHALKERKNIIPVMMKGFEWPDEKTLYECIYSEFEEFKDAVKEDNKENMEEEMGDILFAVVNLARWNKIDAEQALLKANKKFMARFRKMEELAKKPLEEYDFREYDILWKRAKECVSNNY